ncbi:MAG: hypothetical protein AB7V56_05825 [Candidatus Nitrosocosmicus sp.]|jgi:hypothetical protein|nr:hypothetical protein [Candidatus Nitrosocosmicus sp.]HET6588536.1 hypothetical protein [Candidatus Nitrosocosmicus sp.]
MTKIRYGSVDKGFVFVACIILISLLFVKSPVDVGYSQSISLSKTFQVQNSSYITIPSSGEKQIQEYKFTSKDFILTNTSTVLKPITTSPNYDITNATITVKTGVLDGLKSNKLVLDNQSIILPKVGIINGTSNK